MKQRVILLEGGPLNGIAHELQKGWPAPDQLALQNDERTERYWYEVSDDQLTAKYERTEKILGKCNPRATIESEE